MAAVRVSRFVRNITLILAAAHAYVGMRLLPALPIDHAGLLVGIGLLVLSTLLVPMAVLGRFVTDDPLIADLLSLAGAMAMGLFSSLFVLTVLRDVLLLFPGTSAWREPSAIAVPLLALLVTLVGFVNARRVPRVVDVAIPIDGLAPALHGFTIVQISDIHVGPTIKRGYVQAVVDRVNAIDADLVAVTGDVVDGPVERLALHVEPFAELRSRHGTFAVTGNHEYYSGVEEWIVELRRLGMRVLLNEHALLRHDGAELVVAGVTDFGAQQFDEAQRSDPARAIAGAPPDVPRILLAHQPRSSPAAQAAGFDVQLSGHTHGGQFWPWPMFVRLQQPFTAGLHRAGRLWIYTSRGTGYWGPPKRFGAPSEITRIRLVPMP